MANNTNRNKGRQTQSRQSQSRAAAEREALKRQENKRISAESLVFHFCCFCYFLFIAVISGEGLWNLLHNIYVGLFGVLAACVFPVLVIVLIILYSIKEKELSKLISKGTEAIILVLLLSAFIHIVQNQPGADFKVAVTEAFKSGSAEFNGGFFGALIGWILLTLGKAPAIIVDLVLIFC